MTAKDGKPSKYQAPDVVALKLSELRSCCATAPIMTRRNYNALLAACPPHIFDAIVKRLLNAAVKDETGQAAFAALQYLVGKPAQVRLDPDAALNDMRAAIRLALAGNDEGEGLTSAQVSGENTDSPPDVDHIITD